jgi:hypothetical protein
MRRYALRPVRRINDAALTAPRCTVRGCVLARVRACACARTRCFRSRAMRLHRWIAQGRDEKSLETMVMGRASDGADAPFGKQTAPSA